MIEHQICTTGHDKMAGLLKRPPEHFEKEERQGVVVWIFHQGQLTTG